MSRRLRFVFFSGSIVSDFGNPEATTVRALCAALLELGHDVVHCEARRNRYLVDLLTFRGAEPLRGFNRTFPLLTYRQFDPLAGAARRVWFSREISTADVVVGFPGCDEGVREEIEALHSDRTLSIYPGIAEFNGEMPGLVFAPAVLPRPSSERRSGTIAVGYDHAVSIESAANRYSAGTLAETGWELTTELDLIPRYDQVESVAFSATDTEGSGLARALLAVASGAEALVFDTNGQCSSLGTHLEDRFNAALRAERLSTVIISALDKRQTGPDQ